MYVSTSTSDGDTLRDRSFYIILLSMLKVIGFRYIEKNLDGKGSGGGRGSVYKTVSVLRELCGFWRDKENV